MTGPGNALQPGFELSFPAAPQHPRQPPRPMAARDWDKLRRQDRVKAQGPMPYRLMSKKAKKRWLKRRGYR